MVERTGCRLEVVCCGTARVDAMTTFPPFDGSAPKTQQFAAAPEMGIDPTKRYTATLDTTLGEIVIALDAVKAPNTVNNFVFLALHHYYDGVIFHRIIPNFMIQGGDPTGTGTGGPGFAFDDEIHPELNFNEPYIFAMANAGTRGGRGTNGSQFFITTGPTTWLQAKHSIFGEVADDESRRIVEKIGAVATDAGDRPLDSVIVESVTVEAV
jgi:peptidyl-prolyl cis-trans isomerase A (cyclophilin A)